MKERSLFFTSLNLPKTVSLLTVLLFTFSWNSKKYKFTKPIHNIFCYILVQEDPVGKVNRLLPTIGFRYRLLVIQHWHVTKSVKWFLICIIHKDQLNHLRHPSNPDLFSLCWKNLEILVLGKVTKVDVFLKGHKIQKKIDLNLSKNVVGFVFEFCCFFRKLERIVLGWLLKHTNYL